ncbi:MAG TPA: DUF4054 domain-containing protein [Burkholderiaceae bacterium]|nr:DUF4054 domain-containing protein [Burkholderiaceae bacterium]
MSLTELLDFFAPALTATEQERADALAIAESRRPWCLSETEQDEAQALYAAWLLSLNAQAKVTSVREVGVISEKEGDLAKTYGKAEDGLDAGGFKARYDAMARRCSARFHRGACAK